MQGPSGPHALALPQEVEQQVEVPEDMMGHVIGRGGAVIKAIATASGARLKKAGPDKDSHALLIRGTSQQVRNSAFRVVTPRYMCVACALQRPVQPLWCAATAEVMHGCLSQGVTTYAAHVSAVPARLWTLECA